MWRVLQICGAFCLLAVPAAAGVNLPVPYNPNAPNVIAWQAAQAAKYRGFPAPDPKLPALLGGLGKAADAAMTGVGAGMSTPGPIQLKVLVGLGAGALQVCLSTSLCWKTDDGGQTVYADPVADPLSRTYPQLDVGADAFKNGNCVASTDEALAECVGSTQQSVLCARAASTPSDTAAKQACEGSLVVFDSRPGSNAGYRICQTGAPSSCYDPSVGGTPIAVTPVKSQFQCSNGMWNGQGCGRVPKTGGNRLWGPLPLDEALTRPNETIPNAAQKRELSNEDVARITNELWKRASQAPGYDGVPYPADNPITPQEVAAQRPGYEAAGGTWPKIEDLTGPAYAPGQNTYINPQSTTNITNNINNSSYNGYTNVNNNNTNVTPTRIDLGPDPALPEPSVTAPTMESIVTPLKGLLGAGLQNWTLPSRGDVQCPTYHFDVWWKTPTTDVVVDGHCYVIDQNRAVLAQVFQVAWMLLAFAVVVFA